MSAPKMAPADAQPPESQAAEAAGQSPEFDARRLIIDHQAGVWRYLRALGCKPTEADDLTQETFLKVLEKPFREYGHTPTAAYLRRVAHNLMISARRRSGREILVQHLEVVHRDWERLAADDHGASLLVALRECVEQLGQRAREALTMRYRDRTPRREIAEVLRITEHGVRNMLQRAKQRLRLCVEGKLP